MTRGHDTNTAHLVAETIEDARRQWCEVFGRDRADLGPANAARLAAEEAAKYEPYVHPRRPDRRENPTPVSRRHRMPHPPIPALPGPARASASEARWPDAAAARGTCPDLRKRPRSPSGNEEEVTMSITTAQQEYRDRQKSLNAPKSGLRKGSRKLAGERALTCGNTNVPPGGTSLGERSR